MKEMWSYDKDKRFDKRGRRWHFVRRDFYETSIPYEDRPVELYFRDDERREFGLLRFERQKDIPFRNYEVMIDKVMNDNEFRAKVIAPETSDVWTRIGSSATNGAPGIKQRGSSPTVREGSDVL